MEEIHKITMAQALQDELLYILKEREEEVISSLIRAYRGGEVSDHFLRTSFASIFELRTLRERLLQRINDHEQEVARLVNNN